MLLVRTRSKPSKSKKHDSQKSFMSTLFHSSCLRQYHFYVSRTVTIGNCRLIVKNARVRRRPTKSKGNNIPICAKLIVIWDIISSITRCQFNIYVKTLGLFQSVCIFITQIFRKNMILILIISLRQVLKLFLCYIRSKLWFFDRGLAAV